MKTRENWDDSVTCPYCEEEVEICHDDGAFYDESEQEELECDNCEKKFLVQASCSWSYEGEKCDCLNGGEHKWKKRFSDEHYPELQHKEYCTDCGEKREIKRITN